MIPRDHGFGTSFKGVGAYLLHDKDHANTNERVAWTHCHGFGTQNADTAFKVMSAVAMDQRRLKEAAHNRAQEDLPEDERKRFVDRGRKSNEHVWHYSIAWHPEQKDQLTKEHMIDAALASLSQLGKTKGKNAGAAGDQHQAIFICHDDEPHPHVHIVVNRVHPETGKMISKFDDWRKMSRWAEKYEKENGPVYCHQRRANNMTRDMGGAVYGKGHLPHHIATADSVRRDAGNDNQSHVQQAEKEQRAKTAALAKKGREIAAKHKAQLDGLRQEYQDRRAQIREQAETDARTNRAKIFAAYQPQQTELLQLHEKLIEDFEKREATVMGRAHNMMAAVKATWSVQNAQDKPIKLSDYYRPLSDEGERIEAFKTGLREQQRGLEIEREKLLAGKMSEIASHKAQERDNVRTEYATAREAAIARHAFENEALKAEWAQRSMEQDAAMKKAALQDQSADVRPAQPFNEATGAETPTPQEEDKGDQASSGEKAPAPEPVSDALRLAREQYEATINDNNEPEKDGNDQDRSGPRDDR